MSAGPYRPRPSRYTLPRSISHRNASEMTFDARPFTQKPCHSRASIKSAMVDGPCNHSSQVSTYRSSIPRRHTGGAMVAPSHGGTPRALQCVHKQVVAERRANSHSLSQGLGRRTRCAPIHRSAPITSRGKAGKQPLNFPGAGKAHAMRTHPPQRANHLSRKGRQTSTRLPHGDACDYAIESTIPSRMSCSLTTNSEMPAREPNSRANS